MNSTDTPAPPAAASILAMQAAAPVVRKAAVIGAGVMGAGIAAQFANSGTPVVLLDIAAKDGDRRAIAKAGIANQLRMGGFMRADAAELVTPGTIEDDLSLLADADWIVEAIVERLDIKQALYRQVETARMDGSIVSSNTSTLPRHLLVAGMPERFARDFLITHFFNPPRHMRLVEIIGGAETPPAHLARAHAAADLQLGKTVVACRDTPGFIANRIGCYWMAMAASEAIAAGLDVETADAVLSAVLGVPKTGVFGLFDLVGIDLVPQVWTSLYGALPADDDLQRYDLGQSEVFADMLANGRFGRKAKAGFYRIAADKSREAWDWRARAYRPLNAVAPALKGVDATAFCERDDALGRYARRVTALTVSYAAGAAPEIADDVRAIDDAMTLGYAWSQGPFALADRFGAARIIGWLAGEGMAPPALLSTAVARGGFYQAQGGGWLTSTGAEARPAAGRALTLAALRKAPAVLETPSGALWDIGDGVACFEIATKLNVLSADALDALERALELVPARFGAMVLTGAGVRAFSVGADLSLFAGRLGAGEWAAVETFQRRGANLYWAIQDCAAPVVAAAFGLALGGGCEAFLHCASVVAHAELNAGLPESKVGLIPAWGGCTQMLYRAQAGGDPDAAGRVFDAILGASVSTSALEAAAAGILRTTDRIAMNRDRLLVEARARAAGLAAQGRQAHAPMRLVAGGKPLREALLARPSVDSGSAYDRVIAEHLAFVLSGGDAAPGAELTREQMGDLEREALMALVRRPETLARVEHMLATGKPLRN